MKPRMRYVKVAAAIGAMLAVAGLSGCHGHYGHGHGHGSRSHYYYDQPRHNYDGGQKYRRHRGYGSSGYGSGARPPMSWEK